MRYHAIVVGGSFAGLAVASQLRGRVLIVEPKAIGSGHASACATYVAVAAAVGAADSVLQTHDRIHVHLANGAASFRLRHPFCTFDYARFCGALLDRVAADIVRTRAVGLEGNRLLTDDGAFDADCIVDASGWPAAVASTLDPSYVVRDHLRVGIQAEVAGPYQEGEDDGLHFWPDRDGSYGWVFPCDDFARVGVYGRRDVVSGPTLDRFLERRGMVPRGRSHGGFLPVRLRRPTVGPVFVVGDAAGQCFALSGEGIRLAIYFGQACGRIVQQVSDGRLSLEGGLSAYRRFVGRHRRYFAMLRLLESTLRLPPGVALPLLRLGGLPPVQRFLEGEYWRAANPDRLSTPPVERLDYAQSETKRPIG